MNCRVSSLSTSYLSTQEREEQKKQEALTRKQDAQKLFADEEANLVSSVKPVAVKKVTVSEIDKIKEKERRKHELAAIMKEKEKKNISENPEMEPENPNVKMAEILAAEGTIYLSGFFSAIVGSLCLATNWWIFLNAG